MSKLRVHAGDFGKGLGSFDSGSFFMPKASGWGTYRVTGSRLRQVEIATEESIKRLGGTIGWGAAGALILGPVGLLAGLLLGGRSKEVTFVAVFADGRKLLATTDSKTFVQIKAAAFDVFRDPVDDRTVSPALQETASPEKAEVARPDTNDKIELAEWILRSEGWRVQRQPKVIGQRHSTLLATKNTMKAAFGCTPDSITDHSFSLIEQSLSSFGLEVSKIIVGRSVGRDVARQAKGTGIAVTTFEEMPSVIPRAEGQPLF